MRTASCGRIHPGNASGGDRLRWGCADRFSFHPALIMTQFDNTNRFTLFFNSEKKSERGPDWSGTLNVDGKEFFIDGWIKPTRNGGEFISGSIKDKSAQRQAPRQSAPAPAPRRHADRPGGPNNRPQDGGTGFDDMDDSIPF